jgi:hypothetical protein
MPDPFANPADTFAQATPRHLITFILRLCRVEQNVLAAELGLRTHTPLSLWASGRRAVPTRYHGVLREWAGIAFRTALATHDKAVQALPTPAQQRAAIEAFHTPFFQWQLQVLYEAGEVERTARKQLRGLRDFLDKERWTTRDIEHMRSIWLMLGKKIAILREMPKPEDAGRLVTHSEILLLA